MKTQQPIKLTELIQKMGAQLRNPHELDIDPINIIGLAPLERANEYELSFMTHPRFRDSLRKTKAVAVIVKDFDPECAALQLLHPNPHEAMAIASSCFYFYHHTCEGQSSEAFIHPSAVLAESVRVYPFAFVDAEAALEEGCVLYPHTYIGTRVKMGKRCVVFPGAVIMSETEIGDDAIIHPNAVIGADGFGFAKGVRGVTKIPQIGKVVLGSSVEVGSLSNIDRATFDQTSIGAHTKIDSLVHIGHNVEIGERSFLCGQSGVAGSTKIGKDFIAGGQSAVTQGVELGDAITLGGRCGVTQSLPNGGVYFGLPQRPAKKWHKEMIALQSLPYLLKRMKTLEDLVQKLGTEVSPS